MSDTVEKTSIEQSSAPTVAPASAPQPQKVRGGFMGGGLSTTFLFLLAFFMVSYSLGIVTERNNKLTNGAVAGVAANQSTFNPKGFKQLAADLKLDTKKFDSCLDDGKYADAVKKELNDGTQLGVQGTPSFVINGFALVGAQPYDNFAKILDGQVKTTEEIFKMAYPNVSPMPDLKAQAGIQDGEKVDVKLAIDDARSKGDKNAPITIYEFSDFECPFCGAFYQDTYKKMIDNYISNGKARLVFVDHPLSFHPQAQKAAEAARCAQEQNKFWEMHDKLFELQLKNAQS